ncbi:TPA: hypothetical protein ACH3X2_013160 [Trebouxia sp. C0005]|nr:MAG: hypothetical protein FRX49_11496 [Trebouxia sp. A1-2]KAA6419491.1 MAG: hypothetical protein FRX49_10589 [Trebouxia sp. A1-2]
MADDVGHYTPPPPVFDADEATAVAQPLLAQHERGQADSQHDSARSDRAASDAAAVQEAHIDAPADQQQTAPHTPQYTAPTGLDLTSLPDGIATWHEQRGLQILWLLSSIFMVMLDVVGLDVGFLAGLLGIIGSSLAVCNCFQGMDLRSIVKAVRILGYLTSAISGLIGLLLLSALNKWECEELHDIEQCQNVKYLVLFLGAWHGWHAALSFMVGQKATAVKRLLDPISSGMVIL